MTDQSPQDRISLVLGWDSAAPTAALRRNDAGFGAIQEILAAQPAEAGSLQLNAFLYAFLCPAKNVDLFVTEEVTEIEGPVREIARLMDKITAFERDGQPPLPDPLRGLYLEARQVVARRTARDERRTLATLLFSGPSTAEQIGADLGISENLVTRIFKALRPVLEECGAGVQALRADANTLAVVLHLLRSRLGIDPLAVLQRRIAAAQSEGK